MKLKMLNWHFQLKYSNVQTSHCLIFTHLLNIQIYKFAFLFKYIKSCICSNISDCLFVQINCLWHICSNVLDCIFVQISRLWHIYSNISALAYLFKYLWFYICSNILVCIFIQISLILGPGGRSGGDDWSEMQRWEPWQVSLSSLS